MEISYFIECSGNGKRSTTETVSNKCVEVAKPDDPAVPTTTTPTTTTSSTVSQTTTADLTTTAASSTII